MLRSPGSKKTRASQAAEAITLAAITAAALSCLVVFWLVMRAELASAAPV